MKAFNLPKVKKTTLALLGALTLTAATQAEPLKISYSDWMGYLPWDIAVQKGFFKKRGVEVEMKWFEYMPAIDAFAANQVDGVSCATSDALYMTATGARNIMIMMHDYGNGNDQIIAKPGINSVKDLKGKRVGVEIGVISHLFLLKALEEAGLSESDVTLVNMSNAQAAQVFASGKIDAVAAWQPATGQALEAVPGSKDIANSSQIKNVVYDGLFVSPQSLRARRDDWQKVVEAWYDAMAFMRVPENREEVLQILSSRISVTPEKYAKLLPGTYVVNKEETIALFDKTAPANIYSSQKMANKFFLANKVYDKSVNFERGVDESLVRNAK